MADACIEMLGEQQPDVTILYLGQIDEAGHSHGFHPSVPEYISAIERVDGMIGRVLKAIEARSERAHEDWLILVCTDHGGREKGHGSGHEFPEITQTWMIVSGDGAARGKGDTETSQVDVVATALAYLGVEIRKEWGLDGQAVGLSATSEAPAKQP